MRLPKENKLYWEIQLQAFANKMSDKEIKAVQFGKQDSRGTESITLIDKKDCVPAQEHFDNKWELLGYVRGFNHAEDKEISRIGRYAI